MTSARTGTSPATLRPAMSETHTEPLLGQHTREPSLSRAPVAALLQRRVSERGSLSSVTGLDGTSSVLGGSFSTDPSEIFVESDDAEDFAALFADSGSNIADGDACDAQATKAPATHRPTIPAAVVGLCNTIMGTGLVSVPFAFAAVGAGWGSLALLASAAATWFSLRLLVSAAELALGSRTRSIHAPPQLSGEPSYGALAHAAFGRRGAIIAEAAVASACLGFAVSYLVSIAEAMPRAASASIDAFWGVGSPVRIWITDPSIWLVLSLIVVAPLCYARSVDDFSWFSATALASALYLAALIVIGSLTLPHPHPDRSQHPPVPWFAVRAGALETVTIYIFAFTCHQNIFAMYTEVGASYSSGSLSSDTLRYIRRIIDISMAAVTLLYLTVGAVGFFTFGDRTLVVILDNYPNTGTVIFGRIMYALLAALSIPIQVHPCRACLESIIKDVAALMSNTPDAFNYRRLLSERDSSAQSAVSANQQFQNASVLMGQSNLFARLWIAFKSLPGVLSFSRFVRRKWKHWMREEESRRFILTTIIMFVTYAIAAWFHEVGPVMSFVGGTSGVLACFVLPAVFFWHLTTPASGGWRRPLSVLLALAGCLCGFLNMWQIIFNTNRD